MELGIALSNAFLEVGWLDAEYTEKSFSLHNCSNLQ